MQQVGTFRVSLEVGPVGGERFERLDALVDTGATYTWLPGPVLDRLGVEPEEVFPFELADGSEVSYPIATIRVRLQGRHRSTVVVFGEQASEPLLGAVTLEEFGLVVDPARRRLIPVKGLLKRSA